MNYADIQAIVDGFGGQLERSCCCSRGKNVCHDLAIIVLIERRCDDDKDVR